MNADFFTKNIDRTWRLLENLEAGMIGMNTGNSSAAESPFGGIKESGYGKESGKDVGEYQISHSFPAHSCTLLTYVTSCQRIPRKSGRVQYCRLLSWC